MRSSTTWPPPSYYLRHRPDPQLSSRPTAWRWARVLLIAPDPGRGQGRRPGHDGGSRLRHSRGYHVVIEEFLTGPEVSGAGLHRRQGGQAHGVLHGSQAGRDDGDTGLNTGGMGTVAPNPYYTQAIAERCMEEIFLPTIAAMNSRRPHLSRAAFTSA